MALRSILPVVAYKQLRRAAHRGSNPFIFRRAMNYSPLLLTRARNYGPRKEKRTVIHSMRFLPRTTMIVEKNDKTNEIICIRMT